MSSEKRINNITLTKHIKKINPFLRENKKLVITTLIIVFFNDIFFALESSDLFIFGILFTYIYFAKVVALKSKVTFLLCLGLLFAMFFSYLFTGTSIATEKAAVWLVLFLAVGIFQQWVENFGMQSISLRQLSKLPLAFFTKISSRIYALLGPTISFKLAMSPLGKGLLQLVIGKKPYITAKMKYNFFMYMKTYEYFMSGYFFMGETNPYETWVLRKMLQKNDIFFDIGAHNGWYSLNAAQIVGKKGKIIAFEPNPNCLIYLKKNKELNNFTHITLESIAVANKNGNLDFWIGDDMGGALLKQNTMRLTVDKQVKKIAVKTETLDEYCKKHKVEKIDLMKIDVEGAEMQVLQGAKTTLKTLSPDIIIEAVDETLRIDNTSRKELFSFLMTYGYFPYVFTPSGLKSYTLDQVQPTINVYFSKRSSLADIE